MTHISSMLEAAKNSNPHEFSKQFHAEIAVRLGEALAAKRAELISEKMNSGAKFDQKVYKAGAYLRDKITHIAKGASAGASKGAHLGARAGVNLGATAGAVVGGAAGSAVGGSLGALGGIIHHTVTSAAEKRKKKDDMNFDLDSLGDFQYIKP